MNILSIMEFIIGISIGELPLYVQPVAWVFTLALSVVFVLMLIKFMLMPFTAWMR